MYPIQPHGVREKQGETLDGWLRRIGYERYEAKFRKTGIQTLAQLTECSLTEADLRNDLGIESILARRRIMAQIHKMTGQEIFEKDRVEGIVKQLREGYTGENDAAVRTEKVGSKIMLVTTKKAVSTVVEDPEEVAAKMAQGAESEREQNIAFFLELRAMKRKAVQAYWVNWGEALDTVAKVIFPLGLAIFTGVSLSPS